MFLANRHTMCYTKEDSMSKDQFVSIRLTDKDRKLLESDAKKEERPISNLLLWCWKKWRETKK